MSTENLSLEEIHSLAHRAITANGCNAANADALADIVTRAERDGSHSHGLFRIPGYVKSLRSGKVDGNAEPLVDKKTPAVIHVDGRGGFAPLAQATGLPVLAEAASSLGIAVMSLTNIYHFAALWPETEYLSERGLVGMACTAATPMVAPAGSTTKLFGTNPLSFSWPRPGRVPVSFDMATSAMAMGDVMIAARDGKTVPPGTGLTAEGKPTTDPAEIVKGVLIPFGGYKGSAIAMMVELMSAGLTGDNFSFEAGEQDNGDGGPARGGELIIAFSPQLIAGDDWEAHVEGLMDRLGDVRVPGVRRHNNRLDLGPRAVNSELAETIRGLC